MVEPISFMPSLNLLLRLLVSDCHRLSHSEARMKPVEKYGQELPHSRLNRFGAEDHGFDPHQRQFFSREKRHERGIFLLERIMTCSNLLF